MKLAVATCQSPVSAEIGANTRAVLRQLNQAADGGAHVAHFCEGALSGYAGRDFDGFQGFDWSLLRECTLRVMQRARELGVWLLLGSSHPLSGRRKPHNCVYVIDDRGKLVDRYDKRFCSGDRAGSMGDLAHYTPKPSRRLDLHGGYSPASLRLDEGVARPRHARGVAFRSAGARQAIAKPHGTMNTSHRLDASVPRLIQCSTRCLIGD